MLRNQYLLFNHTRHGTIKSMSYLVQSHVKINFSFILPTADFRSQQSFGPGYCFIFISGILNREIVLTKIEINHLPSPDKLVDEVVNLSL